MSLIHTVPPPSNDSPPYGPIDILPSQQFDSVSMTITFSPSGASKVVLKPVTSVDEAQKVSWQLTGEKPTISFEANASATYTLFMTDADAPTASDPKYAYWRHWIVPGLHSSVGGAEATTKREVLTEYVAPGKKDEKAEKHRYLFILFEEPPTDHPYHSTKRDPAKDVFEARRKFDAKKWINESGLKLVGLVWFWGT